MSSNSELDEGKPFLPHSSPSLIDKARKSFAASLQSLHSEERAYEASEQVIVFPGEEESHGDDNDTHIPPFSWKKLWLFTGPGFLMSIAYLDPGNLEGDLQAGAVAGYSLLWLLLVSTIMGLIIQLLAARLGVATGRDLAELCRDEYPLWARLVLWIMAEIAIVGADIQEVIGSAIALRILSNGRLPLWGGVLITGIDGFLFLSLENFGVRKLEAFFGVLITTMALSFAWMCGEAKPDGADLVKGLFVPYIMSNTVQQAVAIVGAVIMPHNIFLHSALVQSRSIDFSKRSRVREALRYISIESSVALLVSFLINLCVMTVFAKGFFGTDEASSIGLANAGQYLQDQYGHRGLPILYIWATGLLAAGQSSTMTGTYAGQFVMAGFLNFRVKRYIRALVTRSVAIIPTITIALLFDRSDQELDQLNEWLNVLQSVQLPFALIPLLCLVAREQVMGVFKIGTFLKVISWLIATLVLAINGYLLVEFFQGYITDSVTVSLILLASVALYIALICYLVIRPISKGRPKTITTRTTTT